MVHCYVRKSKQAFTNQSAIALKLSGEYAIATFLTYANDIIIY
ncbi:MAG: hypothetical protein PUP91_19190 [Rhizonema sp. PD37]|nr:hypothetical protein [Rhizonema sp. PD37]